MVAFASPQRKHESYDLRLLEKLTFVRKQPESGESERDRPAADPQVGDNDERLVQWRAQRPDRR